MNQRDRIWTQAEKDDIALMRLNRVHSNIIAAKYNVTGGLLSHLAAVWGLPKFGSDVPRKPSNKNKSVKKPKVEGQGTPKRKCLSCQKPFYSAHRHNFVCPNCKSTLAWAGATL